MSGDSPDIVRDTLAGTYVLGTLEAAERAAFEARLAVDPALQSAVADWQRRLAPLSGLVEPQQPDPALWQRIATATLSAAPAVTPERRVVDFAAERLKAQVKRWRLASAGFGTALAASLAAVALFAPAYFEARRDSGRYVGIVNTGGAMPALVVSVDTRRGELRIRPLGLKAEPGRSHELWAVRGNTAPVSLGLVDAAGARGLGSLPLTALADPQLVLAVSLEPTGGSPTGQPTGPVVFTGKLIKEE
jgi:anti-sigma-K factor RskA